MKYIAISILTCFIFSCTTKVETIVTEVPVLRASLIYDMDSVHSYTEKYKDANQLIADSYIKKGEQEKEHNPEKALYYFKRAITLNPSLANYKLLAHILDKTKKYQELNNLYNLLVYKYYEKINDRDSSYYLFGAPDEDLWYDHITATILAYDYLAAEDVYEARDMGFNIPSIKARLLADTRIKMDTNSANYKNMLLQFLSGEDLLVVSKKPKFFKDFLASIEDTSVAFEIDEQNVQQFRYNERNDDDGPDMSFNSIYTYYLKEKQDDKDQWLNFNFNHVFPVSQSVTAVVYAIDTSARACPTDMRHIYHRLVTYDQNAIIVDSKIVALQSGTSLQTVRFNHGKFSISNYTRTWKKPYEKNDFDNELMKTEKTGESNYEILPDGKIKETTSLASALQ